MCAGQSPNTQRTPCAFRVCASCAEGARDGVFPQITSSAPIWFSHFFDGWKQHRSGEGGKSRPHSLRLVAVGAKRRALTGLPRSVHSPAEKWEITRSRDRQVFPAALSSVRLPPHRTVPGRRGSTPRLVVFEPVQSHTRLLLLDQVDDSVEHF